MTVSSNFPHIGKDGRGNPTLYVEGKPYLMLGGELHNSSASSADYMEREVWPWLRELNMNTVLFTVAWEDIEEQEGVYDFTLLQQILEQARREDMRLVMLWFGLWKNGESYYVPRWMKQDTETYFRMERTAGVPGITISPFCEAAVEKDRAAFTALMTWLSEHDAQHTVITVQVENEIGLLGATYDRSEISRRTLAGPVPAELAEFCGVSGKNWWEAFGPDAGEYLLAYTYAKAVEKIASSCKAVWPLPMYINAWQDQHPARPGYYPVGGPVSRNVPIWRRFAPSIDLCAPDIYAADFIGVCEKYDLPDNPLFIPETVRAPINASNLFYVFGAMHCIGYAPFGIEDIMKQKAPETPAYLAASYRILREFAPLFFTYRGTDRLQAFIKRWPVESGCILPLDDCDLQLDYVGGGEGKPSSGGLVLQTEGGFYLIGCNIRYTLHPKIDSDKHIDLLRVEEGEFVNGEWRRGRILNGDEVWHTTMGEVPSCRFIGVNLV